MQRVWQAFRHARRSVVVPISRGQVMSPGVLVCVGATAAWLTAGMRSPFTAVAEEMKQVSGTGACKSSAHTQLASVASASPEEVEARLAQSHVLLFMKGSPDKPMCGFSRDAVKALTSQGIDFDYVDILKESAFREAMKEHWATFPQLWIKGVLVGDGEIVCDLAARGELREVVNSSIALEKAALFLTLTRSLSK